MLAEKSEPQPPQRVGAVQHHLHQAAGMGAAVEGQRQLQDMLEIAGQHRLALAMRQPVGVQRHRGAAPDGEQAEPRPGRQQRPGGGGRVGIGRMTAGKHVDNAAEQHRLGELRAGQQQVGAGQDPAQPCLFAEQIEDADIEAKQGHAGRRHGIGETGDGRSKRHSNQGRPGEIQRPLPICSINQAVAGRRQEAAVKDGRFRKPKSSAIWSIDRSSRAGSMPPTPLG